MAGLKLSFGLNHVIPETAKAAWGCRAIVTQDGTVDLVYDRQDCQGDPAEKHRLVEWLNGGANKAWMAKAADLLRDYTMSTRDAHTFTLYVDNKGVVQGDTHGSAGYLYVAAWLKEKANG